MGASQSKKYQHKTARGVTVGQQPLAIAPDDFQKTTLDEILHGSSGLLESKDTGPGSRDEVGKGISEPPRMIAKGRPKCTRNITPKNHNTPVSHIESYTLSADLLCSLLRFHCEAGSVAGTRVMAPPCPTPKYADTRIQYPPGFHDLDVDIILKIFQYYVSVQTDGVFILTIVSKPWSKLVLSSPILWQWVTIDDLSQDWIEKASFCFALSGAYTLQIIVRLPMMKFDNIFPLLRKCRNLFIEVPEYIPSKDVEETTRQLVSIAASNSCHVYWYRAGESLLTESRETFTADLSGITSLDLNADGSEHPNYHLYAQTRDPQFLERGDAYHPLILLKAFHFLQVLQSAPHLRHLLVSHHSMDPIFLDLDLPVVVMIHLEELDLRDIDFTRNGSLIPLMQSLRCPNLATISLSGQYGDVLETVHYFNPLGSPGTLNLRFETYKSVRLRRISPFNLPSVVSLSLHLAFPRSNDDEALGLARDLNDLTKTFSGLLRLGLLCHPDWFETMDKLLIFSPVVWERLRDFVVTFSGRGPALHYTWDAPQSILSISGITALSFRLLDILGGTNNPTTLLLKPRAEKEKIAELKSPIPSVKTLHLEVDGSQPQIQIIQDMACLINMLPRDCEIYFLIPQDYSGWISPSLEPMPTEPYLLRVLDVKTKVGGDTISIFYRAKCAEALITVLSGINGVATEFARTLGSLGSLSMTRMDLPGQRGPSVRFRCCCISDSDLKVAEEVAYAAEENILPNTSVSLQCIGVPLHPDEIRCLARAVDHIEGTLRHQRTYHRMHLRRPKAFDTCEPERAEAFQAISFRVERQHRVRSTAHYIADQNTSTLSLSGAVIPALQLLRIVAETGYLLPSSHAGTPKASPPSSPLTGIASLHLHIDDNWDWKLVVADINSLTATLPQLSSVYFILPVIWWRQAAGTKIPMGGRIMQYLDSWSKVSCTTGTHPATESLFWEFTSIIGAIYGVPFSYGNPRKNDRSIYSIHTYPDIQEQCFNINPRPRMLSRIMPLSRLLSCSKDEACDCRSDSAVMLAKLARRVELRYVIRSAIESFITLLKYKRHAVLSDTAFTLAKVAEHVDLCDLVRPVIPLLMGQLENGFSPVRSGAISTLVELAEHMELRDLVRSVVSLLIELLKYWSNIQPPFTPALAKLAEHLELHDLVWPAIPLLIRQLQNGSSDVRSIAIDALVELAERMEFRDLFRSAIPPLIKLLEDWSNSPSAVTPALAKLAQHVELRYLVRPAIPLLIRRFENASYDNQSVTALAMLADHVELRDLVQPAIPLLIEQLKNEFSDVQLTVPSAVARLAEHVELRNLVEPAIPLLIGRLEYGASDIRSIAASALAKLARHVELRNLVRPAIPLLIGWLEYGSLDHRWAMRSALGNLAKHGEFRDLIQPSILSRLMEWPKN